MMSISQYLDTLNKRYQTGISREHTYRGDLRFTHADSAQYPGN
jgi:hypothetical protein